MTAGEGTNVEIQLGEEEAFLERLG